MSKSSLTIRLTEPVVFLRASDANLSRRAPAAGDAGPPAALRGLLELKLSKPTKIKSIDIVLEGKARTEWPEGIGHKRAEITEERTLIEAKTVFFDAHSDLSTGDDHHTFISDPRRSTSLGPGILLDPEADESYHSDHEPLPNSRRDSPFVARIERAEREARRKTHARHRSGDAQHMLGQLPSYEPRSASSSRPSTSRPDTGMQPSSSSMQFSPLPSPMSSRRSSLIFQHRDNSGQTLEDLRNTLANELGQHPGEHTLLSPNGHSLPRIPSESSISTPSPSPSVLHHAGSADGHDRPSTSHENEHHHETATTTRGRQPTPRGFNSFAASVSNVFREVSQEVKGRVSGRGSRSNSRTAVERFVADADAGGTIRAFGRGGAGAARGPIHRRETSPGLGTVREQNHERDKDRTVMRTFLSETLGLGAHEHDHHAEDTELHPPKWREFRKGTYTYPIAFTFPSNLPPSLHYGRVRRGDVCVCLGEDDIEDGTNVVLERQWEDQLRYIVTYDSRSYPIGGEIPFSVTLLPLAKVIGDFLPSVNLPISEKVDYYAHERHIARHDPPRKFDLLTIKNAHGAPLLPVLPDTPSEGLAASPLLPFLRPSRPLATNTEIEAASSSVSESNTLMTLIGEDSETEAVSQLVNPHGPWTIHGKMKLPSCASRVHFTNRQAKGVIDVRHWLKMSLRVDRGGDDTRDAKGKKKLYDIVIETPVHILACQCNRERTSLPTYTLSSPETIAAAAAMGSHYCHNLPHHRSFPQDDFHIAGLSNSLALRNQVGSGFSSPALSPRASVVDLHSLASSHANQSHTQAHSGHHSGHHSAHATPPISRDEMVDRNYHFARLVAGLESEVGEAPPAYDAVVHHDPVVAVEVEERRGRAPIRAT
ncbi:hypothetical protein BOTBODRAFT_170202 [Botryobasidium botryosum FD-172 SS1]|uniref:Arrestin C-terminal-like domain-containing protein n=1 Tax=Botryobasidium botryosum (strain FD-172 SS1) TaxID=930990 RepID=A0A067N8U0_BOTB1|nr:hypothetical protein BOTBODRAFT_170202 [Botryobasidium botryosum FD-172 SS1]